MPGAGGGIDDLELEPQAGNVAESTQSVARRFQSAGKLALVHDPIAVRLHRDIRRPLGPAVVDDKVADPDAVQPSGCGEDFIMTGIAPVGAPIVVGGWEIGFRWRKGIVGMVEGDEPLRGFVEAAGGNGDEGFGRGEALARRNALHPVTELTVGEPAAEGDIVGPSADELDLPGAGVGNLSGPSDAGGGVFHGGEGEPPPDGQGADLAKSLVELAVALPGALKIDVFKVRAIDATLRAPSGAKPVQAKAALDVIGSEGRDSIENK